MFNMQIPESISKLTTETISDKFVPKTDLPLLNAEEIILQIKKTLNTKNLNNFETGLIFFKSNPTSDKAVIRNLLYLIIDQILKAISESNISEEQKAAISSNIKKIFESVAENIDATLSLLTTINKDKNLLDVKEITLIILGYAIGLIKKVYHS